MMKLVWEKQIEYHFGYINKQTTEKMISVFNDSLRASSGGQLIIRQFNALVPEELAKAVQDSVTASVAIGAAYRKA